jgi:hypothetical protein
MGLPTNVSVLSKVNFPDIVSDGGGRTVSAGDGLQEKELIKRHRMVKEWSIRSYCLTTTSVIYSEVSTTGWRCDTIAVS